MLPEIQKGREVRSIRPDINELKSSAARLERAVFQPGGRTRRLDDSRRFFPFKIYRLPAIGTPGADDWRKFRVRSARVGVTEVSGTDGAANPDSETLGEDGEFTAPSGEDLYVVWYEYQPGATPTATLKHSSSPGTGGGDTYSGDWPGYPGPCTTEGIVCRVIGEIDTSDTSGKVAKVRQILRADEPDWYQACVREGETEKVLNVACDGQPFDFVA
jgi:hypothetical protein